MTGAFAFLLCGSLFVGVPVALVLAWSGYGTACIVLLAEMMLVSVLGSAMHEIVGESSYEMMALTIIGPWGIGITVATALFAWVLYGRGEDKRQAALDAEMGDMG